MSLVRVQPLVLYMIQVFCDMDGVLADFDAHHEAVFGYRSDKLLDNVDWNAIRQVKDFYLNIPPMADLSMLWDAIKDDDPIILTGIPSSVPEAENNKCAWVRKYLGGVEVRCCLSREKYLHAAPGDILIDDWDKHKSLWVNAGGIWITHTSAKRTVNTLRDIPEYRVSRRGISREDRLCGTPVTYWVPRGSKYRDI